jgi:hypothetical protein
MAFLRHMRSWNTYNCWLTSASALSPAIDNQKNSNEQGFLVVYRKLQKWLP